MSTSGGSAGRRRTGTRYTQESEALNQIAAQAEARLAAKRAARAEAREIRMKELEKQQRDAEDRQNKSYELLGDRQTTSLRGSSRRGSDESGETMESTRDLRSQLLELEDKYKKAMMNNAQLDNEKQSLIYQVDLLKDKMEEMEESMLEVQRECKDRTRELEAKKRDYKQLSYDLEFIKQQLELRDKLIEEHGLILVGLDSEEAEGTEPTANGAENGEADEQTENNKPPRKEKSTALLTAETAQLFDDLGEGTLDEKIKKFSTDRRGLLDQIKSLKRELEEEREKNQLAEKYASPRQAQQVNGPDMELLEVQKQRLEAQLEATEEAVRLQESQLKMLNVQTALLKSKTREANRQLSEYKFKLQKAEQDITALEGNVIRLEGQVKRYKTAADNAEKVEEELKQEKRKLTRELRESQSQLEELSTQNNHLQKRLDKIKSARSQLVRS